ncbi:MAG: hypothetical protein Q8916_10815 [Bacteroidota bacterium]|nr:hypothetical protein [Bacteroidota bacterium]MDP4230881.1 hypothetical protein [Bacteroidota bacterium]MDP4237035.1 hypothetical protein [Bacteroidota bacterium]
MKYIPLVFFLIWIPLSAHGQGAQSDTINSGKIFTIDGNLAFGPHSAATWEPSIGFRWVMDEHIRVGIGDFSFGYADIASGTRMAFMVGPVLEYSIQAARQISYSFIAGATMQLRWGAGIGTLFGSMPYGGAQLEFHSEPDEPGLSLQRISLVSMCKVEYVTSDKYLRMPRILPQSAITIAFGLGLHFYLY